MANLVKNADLGNYALTALTKSIQKGLPVQYFAGVLVSYFATALLMGVFLYPTFLKITGNEIMAIIVVALGAGVVQYFRYLLVVTNQLLPTGIQDGKLLIQFVAFGMMVFNCVEVFHAVDSVNGLNDGEFWGLVLFGVGIAFGGFMLEIQFVKKMDTLVDLENDVAYVDDKDVKQAIREKQDAKRNQSPTPAISDDFMADVKELAKALNEERERRKQLELQFSKNGHGVVN